MLQCAQEQFLAITGEGTALAASAATPQHALTVHAARLAYP